MGPELKDAGVRHVPALGDLSLAGEADGQSSTLGSVWDAHCSQGQAARVEEVKSVKAGREGRPHEGGTDSEKGDHPNI